MKTLGQIACVSGVLLSICATLSAQTSVPLPDRVLVKMIADDTRPKIYALNRGNGTAPGTLLALNPTNGLSLAEITVGVKATDMAITAGREALYVVNTGSRTLMRVDLSSFSVTATRTFSTPNTYDLNNPLYVAAGRTNVVYFTDGGWSPGIYAFDFQSGTNLSLFDDDNGAGGLLASRDGKTLYTWRQYGWGAGSVISYVTRFNASGATLQAVEDSFSSWRRDPLDTPLLLDSAETLLFNKQQAFRATNVATLVQSFPENIYAISPDSYVAFGNTKAYLTATAMELAALDFDSRVQVVTANRQSLFRYRGSPSEVVIYPLADLIGAGWETNKAPVASFSRSPVNATTLNEIVFDASNSTDDQGSGQLEYRWDWDNDGTFDTSFTNTPFASHRFNVAGTKSVAVQAKDRYGATGTAVQSFDVIQQDDPGQPGGGNPLFEVQIGAADVEFDPVRPYAYVTGYEAKKLMILNLTNGLVEREFSFDWNPESIAVSPNGQKMYVALLKRPHSYYYFGGHTNYIAEFDLAQQIKAKEFEVLADPADMVVTDSGVLIMTGGSDQWTDVRTYRTSTGQLLGSSGSIYNGARLSLHPSQKAVYAADNGLSPSDIRRYNIDPVTGTILSSWDSRYHGDYPMSGNVWCHPFGTNLIVRGGGVFSCSAVQADDMLYQRSLQAGYADDVAFDVPNRAFFTVANSLLNYYNLGTFELVGSQPVTNGTKYVHVGGNHVFVVWPSDTGTRFQRFLNPAVGAATNQSPMAAFVRTPTNATTLTTITFDAGNSTDDQGSAGLHYRWDWDNDGGYDTAFTNSPVASHLYNFAGTKTVRLEVKDRYGATSVALLTLDVVQQDDPGQPGGGNPLFELQFAATDVAFDPVRPYAYVSSYEKKRLVMLNLTNGVIERQFSFTWNPESVAVSPNGQKMYVALLRRPHSSYWFGGHTNAIAEFDLVQQVKVKEFQILADPGDMVVTDSGIVIIAGGSDQWTSLNSYRAATGELLGTSASIYNGARISLHPSQRAVYTADTGLSPSDIDRYSFDPATGVFLTAWDSPYHGDYEMGGNVWCHPSGATVIVRGGHVFTSSATQTADMRYSASLAGGLVEAAAFDSAHTAMFTVGDANGSTWLRQYDLAKYELMYSQAVTNGTRYVHALNRDLFLGWNTASNTLFQRVQNPALPDPLITRQPESQIVAAGSTITLDVAVRGQAPFAYQWYKDGVRLDGKTNQAIVLDQVLPVQQGGYSVSVANSFGIITSRVAQVTVLVPPTIVAQPQSMSAPAGADATFEVRAEGSPVLLYQWSLDGASIPGATNATLSIANVQLQNVGTYSVRVQNSVGFASSAPASLRVLPMAPVFVTEPFSQTLPAGSDVVFSVAVSGTTPNTCRWLFNGALLNAFGTSLVITNVQATNSGFYTAVVSNSVGQAFSTPAALTVTPSKPWFITQPASNSVAAGGSVTLKAAARGSVPLGYQWRKDGLMLSGANKSDLVLTNVSITQAGSYDVIATNSGGAVTSTVAALVITGAPPVFALHPASLSVRLGDPFALQSLASGSEPMIYQWWFQSGLLPGKTNRLLNVATAAAADSGSYFVIASNAYGSATSRAATVTIQLGPQLRSAPGNWVANAGQDVTLEVLAQGAAPLVYHWAYNNLRYASGTNGTLTLSNVASALSGVYRVTVSNNFGTVTTNIALHVFPQPGTVVAWGDNAGGQLDVPSTLVQAVRTAGGDFHSLALRPDGVVEGWGFNGNGQAIPPNGLSNVVAIAAGAYHSLGLRLNGQVVAWGYNASGQANVPSGLSGVVAIAAGESHSVAVRQDGTVVVWGDNTCGQKNTPVNAGFITGIAAGRNHTVALRNNGTVIAWGQNSSGQATIPAGLTGVKALAAGQLHSLALRNDGAVIAWGDNTYGQTAVPGGLSNVVAIAAGDFHSYALRADGTAVAWGNNSLGQLQLPSVLHHVRSLGSGCYHGISTVDALLNWTSTPAGLVFSWAGPFTLEGADLVGGQFVPVATTSPYTNPCAKPFGLFRLRK